MMMTQRQRKLYQKAEETRVAKVQASKKLKEKKKTIAKTKKWTVLANYCAWLLIKNLCLY